MKEFEGYLFKLHELEKILEASFDGIMVTDGEGNCLLANSSYTEYDMTISWVIT